MPEQVGVDQPDHQQPEDAAIVDAAEAAPPRLGALGHQDDAGAEEHREDGHHLQLEEEMSEDPGP